MRLLWILCLCLVLTSAARRGKNKGKKPKAPKAPKTPEERELLTVTRTNQVLKNTLGAIGRQLMLMQLAAEEKTRSDGDSGIKQVRGTFGGTKTYHSPGFTSNSVCGIHDHANTKRTIGMSEFTAVLNGIEFRTRHNDYTLKMPHPTSGAYHALEDISFPEVPPSVKEAKTVPDQIKEMREYFRAWLKSDIRIRDFRPYFKPVLCYLEGAWTKKNEKVDEPFYSERHSINAETWTELHEKIRFTSYSGRKDSNEDLAYLPTTIMNMKDDMVPEMAQWNYRIACHPIKGELYLNRLGMYDDLGPRMSSKQTLSEHLHSLTARFQLNPQNTSRWSDRASKREFLDTLMEQVPGNDNYQGNLTDNAFLLTAMKFKQRGQTEDIDVNSAFYHRWFRTIGKDAMGTSVQHRGYSDSNIFMAQTTNPKVASMTVNSCQRQPGSRKKVCKSFTQSWTYAIPLEIIYLTPLLSWNPYSLSNYGHSKSKLASIPTRNGRNGGLTKNTAYFGIHDGLFYQTPAEFFTEGETDDVVGAVGVVDQKNTVRKVTASGTRILLPKIEGLGHIRLRYPMMPLYSDGSTAMKELTALKDMVLEQSKYLHLYATLPASVSQKMASLAANQTKADLVLEMGYSSYQPHKHVIRLTAEDVSALNSGQPIYALTSEAAGHSHNLRIIRTVRGRRRKVFYYITLCDGQNKCWDRHSKRLTVS